MNGNIEKRGVSPGIALTYAKKTNKLLVIYTTRDLTIYVLTN